MNTIIRRSLTAGGALVSAVALGFSLTGGATAVAATPTAALAAAPAYNTLYAHVICNAVNIRTHPNTSSTILGVGYFGDPDTVTVGYIAKGSTTITWLYGTLTRRSDHKKVTGWAIATCVH